MSIDSDMRERHGRVLAELAEAGMVMVRRLSAAMAEAEDLQTQVQVGLAYHRVSRAVRQTLALEFRLAQAPDPAPREPAAPRPAAPPSPAAPPRPPTARAGWNEYERDDSDEALEALDVLLDADDANPETVHAAVETCIARLRDDLEPRGRFLSSPVGGGGPREARWRGKSASQIYPAGPLHHPAGGPPPATGEEKQGPPRRSRSALLMSGAARPPPDPWRNAR